jgi:hypothetical protein
VGRCREGAEGENRGARSSPSRPRNLGTIVLMSRRILAPAILAIALSAALAWANRSPTPLPPGAHVDRSVVEKRSHRLSVFDHGQLLKTYSVSLGRDPVGPKTREEDRRDRSSLESHACTVKNALVAAGFGRYRRVGLRIDHVRKPLHKAPTTHHVGFGCREP